MDKVKLLDLLFKKINLYNTLFNRLFNQRYDSVKYEDVYYDNLLKEYHKIQGQIILLKELIKDEFYNK